MSMDDEPPTRRMARHATIGAARWAHLVRCGEARPPGVDIEPRVDDPSSASASGHVAGYDGVRAANTPPSPLSGASSMPVPASAGGENRHVNDCYRATLLTATTTGSCASPSCTLPDPGSQDLNRLAR